MQPEVSISERIDATIWSSKLPIGVYDAHLNADSTPGNPNGKLNYSLLHRQLLLRALELTDLGEHQAAILIAQSANELQIERAISALLSHRGIEPELGNAFLEFVPGYNLGPTNKRLRRLWESLSGDQKLVSLAPWRDGRLAAHIARRNAVAHRGATVSAREARDSILVVLEVMEHMESVIVDLMPGSTDRRISRITSPGKQPGP